LPGKAKQNNTREQYSKVENGLKGLFGEGEEELSPEEQVHALQARNEQLEMQSAMNEAATEYGVSQPQQEYFEYLVNKTLNGLKEGEELSEQGLEEIAKKANGAAASSSTSIDGGAGQEPAQNDPGGISIDAFMAMGIMERSKLYSQNPKLYEQLKLQEAAAAKRK
jgi:hypothetical protein